MLQRERDMLYPITRPATALALLLLCASLSTASAETAKNTIPERQSPLMRTFPPAVADQTPTGTGKFVIFAREEIQGSTLSDSIASAWECIPSRPNVTVTKRAEFCHSPWAAWPLLTLVSDDSKGLYPRFVRLQVPAPDRIYTVNLYDINYRNWDVRCVWQGDQLSAFGVNKNTIFCRDSRNPLCLDATSGKISKDVPFEPLEVDGTFWVVRKSGEKSGTWSYDLAKERFVGHFKDIDESSVGYSDSLISTDGMNRAWVLFPMPSGWRGGAIGGTMVLQCTGQSNDISVPITMLAMEGSGIPVIPIGTHFCFTPDGKVEFSAASSRDKTNEMVWQIDTKSGRNAESVRPFSEADDETLALLDGVPVPDYLRPYVQNVSHFGRGGLAVAFLMYLGVITNQPQFADCTTGVSRDGRHILFDAKGGPLANVFIYGDLQTKQTIRWASPPELKRCNDMEFVWVETP